jgi:hypothetical protein
MVGEYGSQDGTVVEEIIPSEVIEALPTVVSQEARKLLRPPAIKVLDPTKSTTKVLEVS